MIFRAVSACSSDLDYSSGRGHVSPAVCSFSALSAAFQLCSFGLDRATVISAVSISSSVHVVVARPHSAFPAAVHFSWVGLGWNERAHSHDLDTSIFSSVGRRLRPVGQRFEVVWYVKWGWLRKIKLQNYFSSGKRSGKFSFLS